MTCMLMSSSPKSTLQSDNRKGDVAWELTEVAPRYNLDAEVGLDLWSRVRRRLADFSRVGPMTQSLDIMPGLIMDATHQCYHSRGCPSPHLLR